MPNELLPPVPAPPMRTEHVGVVVDNRTDLADSQVMEAVRDQWSNLAETAGLQFGRPSNFALYANSYQGSMLARTPFRTPASVIEEMRLARSVADTDDDIGAIIGEMIAIAFGDGLTNQHRDEKTLEFFNQMSGPGPAGIDLNSTAEEMYREYLISGNLTTLTLFSRRRLQYFPIKSATPVQAQLQVPNVAVLPAENIRVVSNDIMGNGALAYVVDDENMRNWLNTYLDPNTPQARKTLMALEEPVAAALFIGRYDVPWNDGDPMSRGLTVYVLNPQMVHRTTLPKGAVPYARPLLTRNFALLEAKRLLNILDYSLLQGGTNYIVVAKKGTDALPAQQPEIDNLVEQVRHASRSGVMVGDHRLSIEIITPKLDELLNSSKRQLIGRKLKMGLMRQTEEVPGDTGTQGAMNEMELTSRVVSSDRRKVITHAQSTFYAATATRNRAIFPMGAPSIWAPKIILNNVALFWTNLLQARDRGDIPRRYVVEALGFDYEAALAEREREIARGDDDILKPASVPFSNPGEPQDNGPGRPPGSSTNNGSNQDRPGQGKDKFAPNHVVQRNAGETVKAFVTDDTVHYIGELTAAVLDQYGDQADFKAYVTELERDAIAYNQTLRSGPAVVVPVNPTVRCEELSCVKLDEGLRMIVGRRIGDGAMIARALRFSEPHFDIGAANEIALRWGFISAPITEETAKGTTCPMCGTAMSQGQSCPGCGSSHVDAGGDLAKLVTEVAALRKQIEDREPVKA